MSLRVKKGELIPYRTLTRDDFRAQKPPDHSVPHAHQAGAITCTEYVDDTWMVVTMLPSAAPNQRFVARWERLSVQSMMDRECSWFRSDLTGAKAEYVLEHEQIHFALVEISTRQLNRAFSGVRQMAFAAPTGERAERLAAEKVERLQAAAFNALMQRAAIFDRDTSGGLHPQQQRAWLGQVERELAQRNAPQARTPNLEPERCCSSGSASPRVTR